MPPSPPEFGSKNKISAAFCIGAIIFVYYWLTPFCPACHFDWIVWVARQRYRTKQAETFAYLTAVLRARIFFTCSVGVHSNSEESGTMRAWSLSCHVNCGQHQGAATLIR
ncbi:hypothetical protein Tc00.1047053511771.75 [Trypanosoma cruzi]|uniref:Uncharacterized protein n=1 Tax=Trypanosoma cruzi (strain CL Brener) TaxID=353153 RepID=Q4DUJ3_TRYCC|nr:hypothetical protein Tc00.1047053511771.75 [Trypanosoma cruzi]EAN96198.1 hypothetical protein Tc00.1047053511771.75 [Trypanosoma cruzi]|eukprot:XP_818049.1 hypothetical protein [Trypanosoma cruzi strain CL Brener]